MTSFIEVPRMGFRGIDQASLYVNVDDIVTMHRDFDGQTVLEIRAYGADGMHGRVKTYLPVGVILDVLGELARWPGVRSWTDSTLAAYREPTRERLVAAADAERAAARAGH